MLLAGGAGNGYRIISLREMMWWTTFLSRRFPQAYVFVKKLHHLEHYLYSIDLGISPLQNLVVTETEWIVHTQESQKTRILVDFVSP